MRQQLLQIEYKTAANGLRMVHIAMPRAVVGYMGVMVRVGSRDEGENARGLAHFVEHTIFKGTRRRSSWHIINRMEAVGGEINAYTTKEETTVYSVFPSGNLPRAAELIADLVINSQFPERELNKEREVVADEIDSYLDSPADAVFDDFEDLIFSNSAIGHNILGTKEALAGFDSQTCRSYLSKWYVPGNMVAFYAGNLSAERAFSVIEKAFDQLQGDTPQSPRIFPEILPQFNVHKEIESHQCHTIMGSRIGGFDAPERFKVALTTNIIGGPGMNSLLNIALREHRGLVYNVEASTGIFSDCGEFTVYYGCDPSDNALCSRLVTETIIKVADGYITPRRLERAKKQYLGQLVIASENLENRILGATRQTLLRGHAASASKTIEAIRAITTEDIATTAQSLLPLSSLILGPMPHN